MSFFGTLGNFLKQGQTSNIAGQTSGDQLTAILSGIREAVVVIDANRNIAVVNKAGLELLGMSQPFVGTPFSQIAKLHKNGAEITENICTTEFSDDGITLIPQSANAPHKEVSVSITCTKIMTGGTWVITMRDISVERQVEEMKMGFVSIAAHELRTPLTSMKGYLSVFMGDYKDTLNDDQKNLLSHIEMSTDRLLALVENLLNVSRIERGAVEFNPQGLDWIQLVKQIVDEFHERAVEKNIQLAFIPPAQQLSMIRADKVRIGEVLSNLIANALTYTDANGKIDVSVEQQGNEMITHIADTGKGIPKDAISHLFTKFYRVSTGLTQNTEGNGLGLYISKAIIDMHHGRIWVTSEEGKGSVFSFAIPL